MIGIIIFIIALTSIQCVLLPKGPTNCSALFGTSPRQNLPFADLVKYDGYKTDSFEIVTPDGYIITIFRMKCNSKAKARKFPVLFMHGLYLSCDDCIIPGPKAAICYLLADAGYEVWAGNVRGNKYGRKHIRYDPDKDSEFWDFNFDEMAKFDLATIIDFVLLKSGVRQLYYIGHSQGMTILIILCAKRPEYNCKIKHAIGLGAATWLTNTKELAVPLEVLLAPLSASDSKGDLLPFSGASQELAKYLCEKSNVSYPYCTSVLFAVFRCNPGSISEEVIPVATCHQPSGTSIQNFQRWNNIQTNGFSEYDFGESGNLLRYNSSKPPLIDLTSYDTLTTFIFAHNDYVSDPQDLTTLMNHLTNCKNCKKHLVPDDSFCHIDFIYSYKIPTLIMPIIFSEFDNDIYAPALGPLSW